MASETQGVDHIGLTVIDLNASVEFFKGALGWEVVGGDENYPSTYMSDGHSVLTLWQKKTDDYVGFDRRKNIGLHHLALKVPSFEVLDSVFAKVEGWPGVVVEFGPELSGGGPKKHFMVNEPGGTRLEVAHTP